MRWNGEAARERYDELLELAQERGGAVGLAPRLEQLARAGGFPARLGAAGVLKSDLGLLAEDAAGQWTGRFNPRAFDAAGALEVYECAY